MKKLFAIVALVALQVSVADAQTRSRRTVTETESAATAPAPAMSSGDMSGNISGFLGFDAGDVQVGGEYEFLQNLNQGFGGYLYYLGGDEDAGAGDVITFGGFYKLHYAATGSLDLYASPGFGIAMVDTGEDDEMTFGPSFRIGAMFHLTERFALGWEHAFIYNWFNDEAAGLGEFGNVVLRFSL